MKENKNQEKLGKKANKLKETLTENQILMQVRSEKAS